MQFKLSKLATCIREIHEILLGISRKKKQKKKLPCTVFYTLRAYVSCRVPAHTPVVLIIASKLLLSKLVLAVLYQSLFHTIRRD